MNGYIMCNQENVNNEWNIWLDHAHGPYENMAIDELLLDEIQRLQSPLLRFYGWESPSISIGYFQNYKAADHDSFTVVRRPTGGGIVFHDCDITYTLVCLPSHRLYLKNRRECYRIINQAIVCGLSMINMSVTLADSVCDQSPDRASSLCFSSPVLYDIMSGTSKIAGAAQKRTQFGLLHQGSINLKSLPHQSRDETIGILTSGFTKEFNCSMQLFQPSSDFFSRVDEFVISKYQTKSWNERR